MELKPGYKLTEVGVIPEDWGVTRLGRIASIIDPQPDHRTPPEINGGEPYIGISDFVNDTLIDWNGCRKIIPKAVDKQQKGFQICYGDIIFGKIGTIGFPKFLPVTPFRYALSANVILIKPKIEPHFLMSWLKYSLVQQQINQELHSTSQAAFGILKMRDLLIALPSAEEQQLIATTLSDIDELLGALDRLIAKKRDLMQATMQQLLTGKTRLPGFDGEWRVKQIGDIATCFSGGTPLTSIAAYYGGDIYWITSSDLNRGYIDTVEGRISQLGLTNSAAKMVEPNTLLIALYGATSGVTAITKIRAAINQAVLAIAPHRDNTTFLYFKLYSLKDWLISTYTQGGQPNLSGEIVKSIELRIPPLCEQTAIATVLSDIDAEINVLEQRRNKTHALKQAMMQELLTGRIRLV